MNGSPPLARLPLPALFTAALLLVATAGCDRSADPAATNESVAVAGAMGSGDTTGYARATSPRPFSFPEDHGPHPGFKTEWWYVTGNLDTPKGQHLGYQFTIFRIAMAPPDSSEALVQPASTASDTAAAASDWRTDQFYMAHLAVSDVRDERHYDFERFARGAAGLAGARAEPFRVWTEGWQMAEQDSAGDADIFPLRLTAQAGGSNGAKSVALDLRLTSAKEKVLQGERGLSQKGPGAGNASFYYSFTRLPTEGTVAADGDTLRVRGPSWMDREWSTSALGKEQAGWDWFALQLSGGRELMYYQLRQKGGAPSAYSEGVLVGPRGEVTHLTREDVALDVLEQWTAESGATYPAKWRLRVPSENLDLTVTPYFENQVMNTSVRYWEGAVRVEGSAGGSASGSGYVELTGYGEEGEGKEGRGMLP